MVNKTTLHMALLTGLCLLVTWPVLIHGAPDLSWDGPFHAVWAQQFAIQFWHGDWYPRWFTNVNGGFGGPSGFFYPPLASYASTLFWPFMAARDPNGWLVAGYSLVLAEVLSGITAYLWLRSLAKPGAALLGAAVYVIAPYHLAIDLYRRGASAEFWVFAWLPLVLLSAEGLLRRSRWAVPGAAVSYALAVLSHPTTSLCFAPILLAYVFFQSEQKKRVGTTAVLAAALLLGVGLDAAYLLPAMLDQNKASASLYTSGQGDYHAAWLLPDGGKISEGARDLYDKFTGKAIEIPPDILIHAWIMVITLSTLGAIGLLFVLGRWYEKERRPRRLAGFYTGVAMISFFLMTKPSGFIWEMSRFLKFLQFPFRLNVMLVLCLASLVAVAGPYLLQPRARVIALFLVLMAVGWLGADLWIPTRVFSAWRLLPEQAEWSRQWMRIQMEPFDMWPISGTSDVRKTFAEFDRFVETHPPKTAKLTAFSTGQSVGAARVESWQPRQVVLSIEAPGDSQLTVNHFYYAGWQARINSGATVLTASPSPDGLIQFDVPRGNYDIIIDLPRDRAERTGIVISQFSLALLAAVAIWAGLGTKQAGPAAATA